MIVIALSNDYVCSVDKRLCLFCQTTVPVASDDCEVWRIFVLIQTIAAGDCAVRLPLQTIAALDSVFKRKRLFLRTNVAAECVCCTKRVRLVSLQQRHDSNQLASFTQQCEEGLSWSKNRVKKNFSLPNRNVSCETVTDLSRSSPLQNNSHRTSDSAI